MPGSGAQHAEGWRVAVTNLCLNVMAYVHIRLAMHTIVLLDVAAAVSRVPSPFRPPLSLTTTLVTVIKVAQRLPPTLPTAAAMFSLLKPIHAFSRSTGRLEHEGGQGAWGGSRRMGQAVTEYPNDLSVGEDSEYPNRDRFVTSPTAAPFAGRADRVGFSSFSFTVLLCSVATFCALLLATVRSQFTPAPPPHRISAISALDCSKVAHSIPAGNRRQLTRGAGPSVGSALSISASSLTFSWSNLRTVLVKKREGRRANFAEAVSSRDFSRR